MGPYHTAEANLNDNNLTLGAVGGEDGGLGAGPDARPPQLCLWAGEVVHGKGSPSAAGKIHSLVFDTLLSSARRHVLRCRAHTGQGRKREAQKDDRPTGRF